MKNLTHSELVRRRLVPTHKSQSSAAGGSVSQEAVAKGDCE